MHVVSALLILVGCVFGFVTSEVAFKDTLDRVVDLDEMTDTIKTLTPTECDDAAKTDGEYIVSLGTVTPQCDTCFQVYHTSCGGGLTGSFCLQYLPLDQLNFRRNKEYKINVVCVDVDDSTNTVTETVEVRLIPNTPPKFNSQSSVPVTLSNTRDVKAGASVYDVRCTDENDDALAYTLKQDPDQDFFYIDVEGVIRAAKDLSAACFSSVSFEVTCSDRINDPKGPLFVEATLIGANERPKITGLNVIKDIPENSGVGTTVATYSATDDEGTPTCSLTARPTESLQLYQLDTINSLVVINSEPNYEVLDTRQTNVSVTCSDEFCTSEEAYVVVRVTDVNEQIELPTDQVRLTTYEGQIVLNPGWSPIDPDINDITRYDIIDGNTNNHFTIDPDSGEIRSTSVYDVDQSAMPATDFLVVQVTDKGGLTSTATVSLSILDTNDNRPVFTSASSQVLTIDECYSAFESRIGSVTASDRDSEVDGNNVVTYSGSAGPVFVNSGGNVFVSRTVTAGSSYNLQVVATDSGTGPSGSLQSNPHASVHVFVKECVTTTTPAPTTAAPVTAAPTTTTTTAATTTTRGPNDVNHVDDNLVWIVFAGLLGLVFLATLAYMLWRYCYLAGGFASLMGGGGGGGFGAGTGGCRAFCGDCCEPRPPPRHVEPYRGRPPPHGNKGFWQERYPDDDYVELPDRNRTPTPAPIEGSRPLALEPSSYWRQRQLPPELV